MLLQPCLLHAAVWVCAFVSVLGIYEHGYLCTLVHHVRSSGRELVLVLVLVLVLLVLTPNFSCRSECLKHSKMSA